MARLAMSNSSAASLAFIGRRQSFIVILLDNLGSTSEETLKSILFSLVERFPSEEVLLAVLTTPSDVRAFKECHGLVGRAGPLVMVFEQNPFASPAPKDKFLVDLSEAHTPDDIRRIMLAVAERTHDKKFARQPAQGELLDNLRRAVGPPAMPRSSATHTAAPARQEERRPSRVSFEKKTIETAVGYSSWAGILTSWVEKEKTERGLLWAVGGVILGLLLSLAALFV